MISWISFNSMYYVINGTCHYIGKKCFDEEIISYRMSCILHKKSTIIFTFRNRVNMGEFSLSLSEFVLFYL